MMVKRGLEKRVQRADQKKSRDYSLLKMGQKTKFRRKRSICGIVKGLYTHRINYLTSNLKNLPVTLVLRAVQCHLEVCDP